MEEAAAGKIRLLTVESMTDGTIKRLVGGWRLNGRSVDQERRRNVRAVPCIAVRYRAELGKPAWRPCLYVLRDPQPLKADERISDVVGALRVEDQPCRRIQHQLESTREVVWDSDQHAFAVVQPGVAYTKVTTSVWNAVAGTHRRICRNGRRATKQRDTVR